jgi:hypothetical protein
VSEGDSWFDYPLYRNIIDLIDDEGMCAHYRLEISGDTAKEMIGTAKAINNLRIVVEDVRPVCLLFSGGGNDLAAAASRLFRRGAWENPEKYLVAEEMDRVLGMLETAYERMIVGISPIAPIIAHGYDYFAPSSTPVRLNGVKVISGPWIYPAMIKAGIEDQRLQQDIAHVLVDRFNSILEGLTAAHPGDFVYLDLRDTLDIADDWENEIHPTRGGFRKLAERFIGQVESLLPA